MKREDWVILYLSVILSATQWFWVKAEKRAAYLQGRESVYREFAAESTDGTCFSAGGCDPLKRKAAHK